MPYDTQDALKQIPQIMSASQFKPLQKPLIWHTFENRIAATNEPANSKMTKAVTFAPTVDIVDRDVKEKLQEDPAAESSVILLVEDNPVMFSSSACSKERRLIHPFQINQKLSKRMLTVLKYQIVTADDGEDAIQQIIDHDVTIDAILMDQSLPRKDGFTATREIRAMEEAGTLSRRRPIIVVTAVVSKEAQALFKDAGANDFFNEAALAGSTWTDFGSLFTC